jgi:predicted nuclease of predicted toxin-antitoxin system
LRLLLDEHLSPLIAEALRKRGHDVVAVADDPALRGMDDGELFAHAVEQRRGFVTNNVADFVLVLREWSSAGRDHYGLLLTSDESMPRARRAIRTYVEVLDRLMAANAAEDALLNQVRWPNPRDRRA